MSSLSNRGEDWHCWGRIRNVHPTNPSACKGRHSGKDQQSKWGRSEGCKAGCITSKGNQRVSVRLADEVVVAMKVKTIQLYRAKHLWTWVVHWKWAGWSNCRKAVMDRSNREIVNLRLDRSRWTKAIVNRWGKAVAEIRTSAHVWSRRGENPTYGILEGAMETEQGRDTEALSTERDSDRLSST